MLDAIALRFALVGIGNTAAGLAVIFSAKQFVDYVTANLIGYLLVVPLSFLTHRDMSFRASGSRLAAFGRYLPTVGLGYLANLVVLNVGLAVSSNAYLTQTVAIACHVATTYFLSRIFVFRHTS